MARINDQGVSQDIEMNGIRIIARKIGLPSLYEEKSTGTYGDHKIKVGLDITGLTMYLCTMDLCNRC